MTSLHFDKKDKLTKKILIKYINVQFFINYPIKKKFNNVYCIDVSANFKFIFSLNLCNFYWAKFF